MASLVKLVVQEIEERVSKQADNLRKVQMFQLSVLVYELHSKDLWAADLLWYYSKMVCTSLVRRDINQELKHLKPLLWGPLRNMRYYKYQYWYWIGFFLLFCSICSFIELHILFNPPGCYEEASTDKGAYIKFIKKLLIFDLTEHVLLFILWCFDAEYIECSY